MFFKHLIIAFLLLGLGFAGTAQAGTKQYSLSNGSGAQVHIGDGLPLPVASGPFTGTGSAFPPLLI